ncbi:MAG: glycerol-3-phosphate dehydrogenase subunit [Actinomycetota bacterium]|jgi:Fe-S oxidoreductase|nr:glycerol-3-phosphate dehydrogenase subunit [Actinomycetota bacterium]
MTTTYDPKDPQYFDEGDLRGELTRVYDLCHGCRLCFNLCTSFPTMFEFVDSYDGDVHRMTAAEQDQVVDECFQCKICYVKCPYIPPHEWNLDFPRLMLRAEAVRHRKKDDGPVTERIAKHAMAKTDLLGKVNTKVPALVNKVLTDGANTPVRKLMEKATGISATRVLPPYAKQRFTTWFKKRTPAFVKKRQARAAIFPTCFVEYMEPQIGKDLVKVYELNGVECSLAGTTSCCGAPQLHGGDVAGFVETAKKNVSALAESVRQGKDVVVPQPTCGYVVKRDYVQYVGGPEAELVAANTYDAAEYLIKLHRGDGTALDTEFTGDVPDSVTYHVSCHLQAQNIGLKSRDLMKLTGTKITLVNKCSGIDGTWGYRAANIDIARKVAKPMGEAITAAGNDVVTGDCHLANGAIVEETGQRPMHPISMVARAYGIPAEDGDGRWGSAGGTFS